MDHSPTWEPPARQQTRDAPRAEPWAGGPGAPEAVRLAPGLWVGGAPGGRGGASLRAGVLQRMQQVQGNRAVRRFVQRCGATPCDCPAEQQHAEPAPQAAAPPDLAPVTHHSPESTAAGFGGPVNLRGRTDASFSATHAAANIALRPASGCTDCADDDPCVRAAGPMTSTYVASTTVTLPAVTDFPDLNECEQRVVQNAITGTLAPHEQRHVRAFNQYSGTTQQAASVTGCRSGIQAAFDTEVQRLGDIQDAARQQSVRNASAQLDPFTFNIDFSKCPDSSSSGSGGD
ncbi:MAG TPA: hypothetical protein VKY74_06455 [Chloroflexia bacterium]|nr:hypothetical protein [Chloroflexia bacterium]